MPPPSASKVRKPLIINSTEERILKAVYDLRFVTRQEITALFFSEGSGTHSGAILRKLCGGRDYDTGQMLYRFRMPIATTGPREFVYCLGAKAGEVLALDEDYRFYRPRFLSYSPLLHDLSLSRIIAAATAYFRTHPTDHLIEKRLCYQIARNPPCIRQVIDKKETRVSVIPDAWLSIVRVPKEKDPDEKDSHDQSYAIWLEVDRGTEYRVKFQQLIRHRLELVRRKQYETYFGTKAILFLYITTGNDQKALDTRRHALQRWTKDVLAQEKLNRKGWASMFKFVAVTFDHIYDHMQSLFEEPVWYKPDASTPVGVFD
jgi:Replication-relaxation